MLRAVRGGAAGLAATALLLLPAFWNGFPLLQYDTGGYLARWYEGTLETGRSAAYGLLVAAGAGLDFWPVILLQAALTVWVLALLLRAHSMGGRPLVLLALTTALVAGTSLPWLADLLLTDIFALLAVLGLYLLVARFDALRRWEWIALVILIAFSAATHNATLAILVVLTAAALAAAVAGRLPLVRVARPAAALTLGAVMLLAANYAVARRVAWTPGGYGVVFARLLQDGIVARYLRDHCPDPRLRLCAHRDDLPATADMFLWGKRPHETVSLFDRLGRFDGLGPEMRAIVLDSIAAYPWLHAETAVVATVRQLGRVATGEGTVNTIWHTYAIIKKFTPQAVPAMSAARQQREGIDFAPFNQLHVPIALGSMALLPLVLLLWWRRMVADDAAALAAFVGVVLLANAVICGCLSNPHDRYGARLAPLAPLAVAIAALSRRTATQPQTRGAGVLAAGPSS